MRGSQTDTERETHKEIDKGRGRKKERESINNLRIFKEKYANRAKQRKVTKGQKEEKRGAAIYVYIYMIEHYDNTYNDFTYNDNRTAHIRYKCRKTTVLSCHRRLINTGVEKMNNI